MIYIFNYKVGISSSRAAGHCHRDCAGGGTGGDGGGDGGAIYHGEGRRCAVELNCSSSSEVSPGDGNGLPLQSAGGSEAEYQRNNSFR